jgi:hypothetical protein
LFKGRGFVDDLFWCRSEVIYFFTGLLRLAHY